MKRGVILLAIVIVLALSVVAVDPTVILSPSDFYETNSVSFELNVSNFHGNYEISSISLNLYPLEVTNLVDYKGWTETLNSSEAEWSEGSIANNVVLSVFELLAKAPLVTEDQDADVTVTLIDEDNNEHQFTFPITIKNDDTPPELSDYIPVDGGFVLEGETALPVQVRAIDNETGIANATFHYVRCNFHENITPTDFTHQLIGQDDLYSNTVDFSQYENEQQVCFDFSVYNNGGDETTYQGTLTVDGLPPEVFLVAPLDGALVSLQDEFSFYASDNLDLILDCELLVDGEVSVDNISAAHMDTIQIPSADVEEGQHAWSIRCSDEVGLMTETSSRNYTLDKTPPTIVMTTPENDSIVADSVPLEFEVSDNYQLAQVWYEAQGNTTYVDDGGSFSINISEWPDGPSEVTVTARDSVGNERVTTFSITIDRTAPELTLVSPEDNSTDDVHVDFVFVGNDDYDTELDCQLYLDDIGVDTVVAMSGEEAMFQRVLSIGDYTWKVQCVDDAGNEAETPGRMLSVVDLTGPDIAMNNPDVVFRGDPIEASFEVTDISGVETVIAQMRDPNDDIQTISLNRVADTYTASIPTSMNSTLGNYVLEVEAVDTLNNSNNGDDNLTVTYKYIIDLEVAPVTASPSASVTASGIVIYDNGSDVPEEAATLIVPVDADNSSDVALNLSNGSFSHTFTAPGTDGSYEVGFSILSEGNGQVYTDTAALTVSTPQTSNPGSSGGNGGSSGGHGGSSPDTSYSDNNCNTDWRCIAWSPCKDGKQKRTCVDLNHCSNDDSKRIETQSCTMPVVTEEVKDENRDTSGDTVVATRREVPQPEVYEVVETSEDSADPVGVGKASGFLNIGDIGGVKILLVMMMMTVLLGTLKKYGGAMRKRRRKSAPQDILSGKDRLGLEDYLNKRRK